MSPAPIATAAAAHAAVQPIPFRPESQTLAASAWDVLGTLLVLLLALIAAAFFAKRMRWLDRWSPRGAGEVQRVGLRIDSTLRLNMRTTVYSLSDVHGRYLLVLSGSDVKLTVVASHDRVSPDV